MHIVKCSARFFLFLISKLLHTYGADKLVSTQARCARRRDKREADEGTGRRERKGTRATTHGRGVLIVDVSGTRSRVAW
jgi:hypothetical protein